MANSDRLPAKPSAAYWTIAATVVILTIAAAAVGFVVADAGLAKFVQGILTPLLALCSGIVIADLYHRIEASKNLDRNVGQSAYATMVTLQGMMDVDKQLAAASNELNEGNQPSAQGSLNLALTISRLTLRHAFQALRESENISGAAVARAKTDFAGAESVALPERQKVEQAPRSNNSTVGVGNA